ncbi:MAG: hypothetical protein KDC95_03255 [Planctomycetes bacterium]|nr:hypothetical protein [Planctomycetota bacterium]
MQAACIDDADSATSDRSRHDLRLLQDGIEVAPALFIVQSYPRVPLFDRSQRGSYGVAAHAAGLQREMSLDTHPCRKRVRARNLAKARVDALEVTGSSRTRQSVESCRIDSLSEHRGEILESFASRRLASAVGQNKSKLSCAIESKIRDRLE